MKRYFALIALMLLTVPASADDVELFCSDVSKTPTLETDTCFPGRQTVY